jgi:hypothetical protein
MDLGGRSVFSEWKNIDSISIDLRFVALTSLNYSEIARHNVTVEVLSASQSLLPSDNRRIEVDNI